MEWNACVLSLLTRLYSTSILLLSDYPISNLPSSWFHVQKFAFLATTSHATPGSCIQRVALKGSPQNVPLFMSSSCGEFPPRAHAIFMACKPSKWPSAKSQPRPPPSVADKQAAFLSFPFFFLKVFRFFLGKLPCGNEMRLI